MAQRMLDRTHPAAPERAYEPWAELDALCLSDKLQFALIRQQLPKDVSKEDLRFIDALSPAKRQQVWRRLYAILRSQNGLPAADASRLAGVTVANFYRLKRLWGDRRNAGLSFLSGYAARKTRQAGTERIEALEKAIAEVMNGQDVVDLSVKEITKMVQRARPESFPSHTLEAAARALRQKARRKPEILSRIYGSNVLIDYSAVSIVRMDRKGTISLLEVAWVIEEASALILSAVPVIAQTPCRTQWIAARSASKTLGRFDPDVWRGAPARIEAIVPDSISDADRRYVDMLITNVGRDSVSTTGARRYGRFILDVVGPFLGRIKIVPRATFTHDTSAAKVRAYGRDPLDLETAERILRGAVEEHNAPILEHLRQQPFEFSGRSERGGMEMALLAAITQTG